MVVSTFGSSDVVSAAPSTTGAQSGMFVCVVMASIITASSPIPPDWMDAMLSVAIFYSFLFFLFFSVCFLLPALFLLGVLWGLRLFHPLFIHSPFKVVIWMFYGIARCLSSSLVSSCVACCSLALSSSVGSFVPAPTDSLVACFSFSVSCVCVSICVFMFATVAVSGSIVVLVKLSNACFSWFASGFISWWLAAAVSSFVTVASSVASFVLIGSNSFFISS